MVEQNHRHWLSYLIRSDNLHMAHHYQIQHSLRRIPGIEVHIGGQQTTVKSGDKKRLLDGVDASIFICRSYMDCC